MKYMKENFYNDDLEEEDLDEEEYNLKHIPHKECSDEGGSGDE